jgi:hypothetical protein
VSNTLNNSDGAAELTCFSRNRRLIVSVSKTEAADLLFDNYDPCYWLEGLMKKVEQG